MNRVAVTGIGVVSPVGSSVEDFWSALVDGRSGISRLVINSAERLRTRMAAQVAGFDPSTHFTLRQIDFLDRFSQFAVVAARAAVRDADLRLSEEEALSTAIVIGTGVGGQATIEDSYHRLYGLNATRANPLSVPRLMANAASSQVSMDLRVKGPTWTVATACAAGTHAIGQAFHLVRNGGAPIAIAGGSEACLTLGSIMAWEALRVLSADTCRPFSKSRSGLVLGEGAAMLVLEAHERAVARGARIYAEITGFGMSADAGDITAPDVDGATRAMRAALADAGAPPDSVGYVNAHGTGTLMNDRTESDALRRAFGTHADRLAVSSSKAVLGHGLGAAGALEFAATALALHTQTIPPTANFQEVDPECSLDYVPNTARDARFNSAMSNSFAFGGLNAVLVACRG